mmetsp:Transcript_49523/g.111393  ORF Transcript_49523/g.111393 Transcript_49523/m.111393 type:complete len:207 (+) Transcript_49523:661-1281(+)
MPHDEKQQHAVVDEQDPPETVGVREACKYRECQCPRGDLEGAQQRPHCDVLVGHLRLHLLLPHGHANANGDEGHEYRDAQQGGRALWSICTTSCWCTRPDDQGVELHQRVGRGLEQSLHQPQCVEIVRLSVAEDALVSLGEYLPLDEAEEELGQAISYANVVDVAGCGAAGSKRDVEASNQPRPGDDAGGEEEEAPLQVHEEQEHH